MARIAYVDHSFHSKTLSTTFLADILRRHGHEVDLFWDDSWKGGKGVPFVSVINHDVVIMFQTWCEPVDQYYRYKHNNVIAVPMLDSFGLFGDRPVHNCLSVWEKFQGCKVISFSSAVHGIAASLGISSLHTRYAPPPAAAPLAGTIDGLHGFFWIRHEDHVSWPMVKKLIGPAHFDSLHLHVSPDPDSPGPTLPTPEERARYNITTSSWFENKDDFFTILQKANVVFAPRAGEGIGQSFLESMARGQCVVALDNGTMNEYIFHGLNGLLYRKDHLAPLDFGDVRELGTNAWRTVAHGRDYWLAQEQRLVDYILKPADGIYGEGTYRHAPMLHEFGNPENRPSASRPLPSLYAQVREALLRKPLVRKTRFLWRLPYQLVKRVLFRG